MIKIMINNLNIYTGDGSYAEIVYLSKVYDYFYSYKSDLRYSNDLYPGVVIESDFYSKFKNIRNRLIQESIKAMLLYRQEHILSKFFSNLLKNNYNDIPIFHYLNPSITPFYNYNGIVTIADTSYLDLKLAKGTIKKTDIYAKKTVKNFSIFRNFKNIIVPSNFTKKMLIYHGFDKNNITVIHHAVNPIFHPVQNKEKIRESLGLPKDKKIILSVSSLAPRKRPDIIKEISYNLPSDYLLVRVGEKIGKSVNFKGVDYKTLNNIYNASDVLLFPTEYEGFGRPIIEAFATELPVVTSNIEIMNEVTKGAAILCYNDAESMLRGIKEALNSKDELVEKMRIANKYYNIARFSREMSDYYSKISE